MKLKNFLSKFNLMNGKMEWVLADGSYDYRSEIRSSGYADMLNDSDRNRKFYRALRDVIAGLKRDNRTIHVLDIGCGSGILSMMALQLGADQVTACESFRPMYECAQRVLARNGLLSDRVNLVHCNSTELRVGVHMKDRANVLVSEIFDTELIGEGVLPVFNHAIDNLLTERPIIIPFKARFFCQLIDSEFVHEHSWLKTNEFVRRLPISYQNCSGYSSVFDIQASVLINYPISLIGRPVLIKEIDFARPKNAFVDRVSCSISQAKPSDHCQSIIWWELVMTRDDDENDCISTAPDWLIEPTDRKYHWRDHWLQAVSCIRFNPSSDNNNNNHKIDFDFCHDKFSIWLSKSDEETRSKSPIERPFCSCGLHLHVPRNRLYQLNSLEYHSQLESVVKIAVDNDLTNAVIVSDFSFLTIALANFCCRLSTTHTIIDHDSIRNSMQELVDLNCSNSVVNTFSSLEKFSTKLLRDDSKIGIFGDPYFIYSHFPWDNIHFWYAVEHVRKQLAERECVVVPRKMSIKGLLVKFDQLDKIIKRVGTVEDFDLSPFDDLISEDVDRLEDIDFESKFLWEYECFARSQVRELVSFDMNESIERLIDNNVTQLTGRSVLESADLTDTNGLVLWVAWELSEGVWVDNSLQSIDSDTDKIAWKPITKQAVHFLQQLHNANSNRIEINTVFNVSDCRFTFAINT